MILTAAMVVSNTGSAAKVKAPCALALSAGSPSAALRTHLSPLLLADLTDEKDRIVYGTDPEMDRAADEEAREEKEKQEKSWKMLQQMNLYQNRGSKPAPPPTPASPKQ